MWAILWKKSTMETIQVVLDAKLLKAADSAAKRQKVNRSALIRQALEEHLQRCVYWTSRSVIGAVIGLNRKEGTNTFLGRM